MPSSARTLLKELERCKSAYGGGRGASKLALLRQLEEAELKQPAALLRLHDILCFLAAYPDDRKVLRVVRRMLAAFDQRADLCRFRESLADSGIAGTTTYYRFFAPTARWLAKHWPDHLTVDWVEFDQEHKLDELLHLLALYSETPGLDESGFSVREWVERLKGPEETDAAFLIKRFAALRVGTFTWETLYNSLDLPLTLSAGGDAPNRTRARYPVKEVFFQDRPLARSRPSMPAAVKQEPRSITKLTPRQGRRMVDLARTMMVSFSRELNVFSYASRNDASLIDCGRGLSFAFIGAIPERRLVLESVYGYLVLKNGIPVGYGTVSSLFGSSEIAFNIFAPFRGYEAGHIFVRLLSVVRSLFRSDSFTLYPYQLGEDNTEAIRSGAWWFYQKLGFRARDPEVLKLMNKELKRMRSRHEHRSNAATLRRLATANVYLHLGRPRDDVIGILPLENAGLAVTDLLARRFGSDRERAARVCRKEAAELLGVSDGAFHGRDARLAWERWAPLVLVLPGVERWSRDERSALVEIINAKGGASEREFVLRFDRHGKLRNALRKLAN
jgi:hypothetical protein